MQDRKIERTKKFNQNLRKLSKTHRGLTEAVESILYKLASDNIPDGDRLQGYGEYRVFKIRCGTGSRGKRSGARIIYSKDDSILLALTVYLKNRKEDVFTQEILAFLQHFQQSD